MKLSLTFLLGLYLWTAFDNARACSIAPGFETRVETWQLRSGEPPDAPDVQLHEFLRGDNSAGSRPCGHIAYLELRLVGAIDDDIVGFHITTVDGANSPFFIPAHLVYPRRSDDDTWSFWFSWPELMPNNSELPPISLTLEISQVSGTGAVSISRTVLVEHQGG